jgi:hypothetical protein
VRRRWHEEAEDPSPSLSEHGGALAQEDQRESGDSHGGEQALVGREEGDRGPQLVVEVEPPPLARSLHHRATARRVESRSPWGEEVGDELGCRGGREVMGEGDEGRDRGEGDSSALIRAHL